MKRLIFILLMLTYIQATAQVPPKKATKIIVLIKDSSNALLDRIVGVLYDKGFTIENKDEKVKFVSTKEMPGKKWPIYYKVRAKINDTAIVFSGLMSLSHDSDYYNIDYSGSKIGANRELWKELEAIARIFGDQIVYSK